MVLRWVSLVAVVAGVCGSSEAAFITQTLPIYNGRLRGYTNNALPVGSLNMLGVPFYRPNTGNDCFLSPDGATGQVLGMAPNVDHAKTVWLAINTGWGKVEPGRITIKYVLDGVEYVRPLVGNSDIRNWQGSAPQYNLTNTINNTTTRLGVAGDIGTTYEWQQFRIDVMKLDLPHPGFLSTITFHDRSVWGEQALMLHALTVETDTSVNGRVVLGGYSGSLEGRLVDIRIWKDGQLSSVVEVEAGANGEFHFLPTLQGDVRLVFRFLTGLVKSVPANLGAAPINGLVVNLTNGDCDRDNDVDIDDYDVLAGAYGTFAGDPGFDPNADLDGDGDVDIDDYDILAGAYGQFGD